jgi:hypothetical protein
MVNVAREKISSLTPKELVDIFEEGEEWEKTGAIKDDAIARKVAMDAMGTDNIMAVLVVVHEVWRELFIRETSKNGTDPLSLNKTEEVENYDYLIGKTVEFKSGIDAWDSYADEKIRAKITGIRYEQMNNDDLHEYVIIINVDYSEFEEYNKEHELENWYNKDGTLVTCRVAGQYEPTQELYFGSPKLWPFEEYFEVLPGKNHAD